MFGGYAQLFDLYTDIYLLSEVYHYSVEYSNLEPTPENAQIAQHYQVALTVMFLALTATFMAQQSCIIGMKFAQGDFEPQNFKQTSCFSKLVNIMLLTFTGVFFVIPVEILDNLCKMFKLFGLLFGGATGVQKVQDCFTSLKQRLTRLNTYQLNCLEQQRKVTALLFENLPFTLLIFVIKLGLLNCPEQAGGSAQAINISLGTTLLAVLSTLTVTYIESRWLQESTLSYMMTKMTANNNWIPFIHLIAKRDCTININYGDLSIVIPFVSHALGFQMFTQYEFSDNTLSYLLNELKLWSSEIRGQGQKVKYRLIFTKDCLNQVSLNTFVHFVQNFPTEVFHLEVQLDWRKFYERAEKEGFIQYAIEDGQKRTYSPTGVPLL